VQLYDMAFDVDFCKHVHGVRGGNFARFTIGLLSRTNLTVNAASAKAAVWMLKTRFADYLAHYVASRRCFSLAGTFERDDSDEESTYDMIAVILERERRDAMQGLVEVHRGLLLCLQLRSSWKENVELQCRAL
jgi:hypothetical protein